MCVLVTQIVSNSVTLWTIASQAPMSLGFYSQEDWNGLPFPSPGVLPDPDWNLCLLHGREILCHWVPWEAKCQLCIFLNVLSPRPIDRIWEGSQEIVVIKTRLVIFTSKPRVKSTYANLASQTWICIQSSPHPRKKPILQVWSAAHQLASLTSFFLVSAACLDRFE